MDYIVNSTVTFASPNLVSLRRNAKLLVSIFCPLSILGIVISSLYILLFFITGEEGERRERESVYVFVYVCDSSKHATGIALTLFHPMVWKWTEEINSLWIASLEDSWNCSLVTTRLESNLLLFCQNSWRNGTYWDQVM